MGLFFLGTPRHACADPNPYTYANSCAYIRTDVFTNNVTDNSFVHSHHATLGSSDLGSHTAAHGRRDVNANERTHQHTVNWADTRHRNSNGNAILWSYNESYFAPHRRTYCFSNAAAARRDVETHTVSDAIAHAGTDRSADECATSANFVADKGKHESTHIITNAGSNPKTHGATDAVPDALSQ